MKKGKFLASILATSTFLFSGAIVPSAHASQANIADNTSTVENAITSYQSSVVFRLEMKWAGRYPYPQIIEHSSELGKGTLFLQNAYYDPNTNMTYANYQGLLFK